MGFFSAAILMIKVLSLRFAKFPCSVPKRLTLNYKSWKQKVTRRRISLPADLLDTVNNVVTPKVVLPGTESVSIQKETQEMTTIKMVGM